MDDIIVLDYSNGKVYIYTLPRLQMYDSEIEDQLDSMSFDLSNINWMVNNKHSESLFPNQKFFRKWLKSVKSLQFSIQMQVVRTQLVQSLKNLIAELMEATTFTIKDTKGVIADVQSRFPTAQKSTIVKIFKSLL